MRTMSRLPDLLIRNRATPGRQMRAEANADGSSTLYLYDTIVSSQAEADWWGGVAADTVVKEIRGMAGGAIAVRINSPGGDVFGGRAIEQALRDHPGPVTVHVDGIAASIASVIAMAGSEIRMGAGAMMMIHKAWTIGIGNSEDFLSTAALLEKIDGTIAQTYATRAGGKVADFADMMSAETWLTAEEAVAAGLATAIDEGQPKALIAWDVSAYANAPQPSAKQQPPAEKPDENKAARDQSREQRVRMLQHLESIGI